MDDGQRNASGGCSPCTKFLDMPCPCPAPATGHVTQTAGLRQYQMEVEGAERLAGSAVGRQGGDPAASAAAGFGPAAAAAAMAVGAAPAGPSSSEALPPPLRSLVWEGTAHDQDAAAAVMAYIVRPSNVLN